MIYVGIDVASEKHDVCIMSEEGKIFGKKFQIKNTMDEYKKLLSKINEAKKFFKDSNVRIGIESTGVYSSTILNYLSSFEQTEVIFINPILTNMFQLSQSVHYAKTDAIDAEGICNYLQDKQKKLLLKFYTDVYLCFNTMNRSLIRWAVVPNFRYYPTLGVYVKGEIGEEKYREEKVARLEKKVEELEKTIGNVVITEKREKKAPIINLKTRKIKKGNANLTAEVEDDEVDIAEEIGKEVLKETNPTETLVETAEIEEVDEIPVETPTTNYIDDLFKDLE